MSDSGVLDLGRLELHLPSENLSLHITGEAIVNAFESINDDGGDALDLFSHVNLNKNEAARPWISKGHSYRVVVDLELEAGLGYEDQTVSQVAAMRLKSSKA